MLFRSFDEDNRPIYLIAPNCEDCEPLDNARIPEILFGADFDFDEPTQFVEYDAVLDTTTDLSSDEPTNWGRVYSDANSSGSFDEGDPSWLRYSWWPAVGVRLCPDARPSSTAAASGQGASFLR